MRFPGGPRRRTFTIARRARRHFAFALEGQRRLLVGGVGAALSVAGIELLRPWPLSLVIDVVIGDSEPPSFLAGLGPEGLLHGSVALLVLIPLTIALLQRLSAIALAQVGRKVTTRVRRRVCEHLQLLPLSWHQRAETGDLLMRVMGDVSMVRDIMFAGWVALLQRALLFVATLVLLFWIEPAMALLALLPLPFLLISVKRSGRKMKEAVGRQRKKEGGAASLAAELLQQIRVVKAFGAERRSAQLFGGLARSGEKAGVIATRISTRAALQAEVVTGLGLAMVLLFGTRQVLEGDLGPGMLVALLSWVRSLYKPLRKLSLDGVKLAKAAACAERVFAVLEEEPERDDRGARAPFFAGRLRFEDVHFRYRQDRPALEGLDFEVEPGRLAVLMGANGSGKTTSIGLLLRLFAPDSGRILIDGQDVQGFDLASYRERFAYVPQEDLLFSGTIGENVSFGRPQASTEEVRAALTLVTGEDDWAARFPEGLDTEIGERGKRLSGGQRRLISLARAALRDANLLLLDEPLESLDRSTRREVARGIRRLAKGRTTIVVSHTAVEEIDPDQVVEIIGGRRLEMLS